LWTAYTILRNLGGEVGVRSAVGQGTTFELLLPHAPPTRDSSWFRKEQP
jgi:signal transduction histidine kinase